MPDRVPYFFLCNQQTIVSPGRTVKFTYHVGSNPHTFNFPVTEPVEEELLTKLGENITVINVTTDIDGIELHLHGIKGDLLFRFEPVVGWDDFLAESSCSEIATGLDACKVCNEWQKWSDDNNAKAFLKKFELGEMSFEDIPQLKPSLYKHPKIIEALLQAIENGTPINNKKGKLPLVSDDLWELYNWACYYKITEVENNLDKACDKACQEHPELVPETWKKDPGGTLKKQIYRKHLDEHPFLHQTREKPPSGQK